MQKGLQIVLFSRVCLKKKYDVHFFRHLSSCGKKMSELERNWIDILSQRRVQAFQKGSSHLCRSI